MDWLDITPTINVFEVFDLCLALVGVIVSSINLRAAQRRLAEWIADGRNGMVEMTARTRVHHEWLRLIAQIAFIFQAFAVFQTSASGPTVIVARVALATAITCTLLMSASSWRARARLERMTAEPWNGQERRATPIEGGQS